MLEEGFVSNVSRKGKSTFENNKDIYRVCSLDGKGSPRRSSSSASVVGDAGQARCTHPHICFSCSFSSFSQRLAFLGEPKVYVAGFWTELGTVCPTTRLCRNSTGMMSNPLRKESFSISTPDGDDVLFKVQPALDWTSLEEAVVTRMALTEMQRGSTTLNLLREKLNPMLTEAGFSHWKALIKQLIDKSVYSVLTQTLTRSLLAQTARPVVVRMMWLWRGRARASERGYVCMWNIGRRCGPLAGMVDRSNSFYEG